MNVQEIFERMKQFVNDACNAKNYLIAVEAAKQLGFHDRQTSATSSVMADLKFRDISGGEVSLVAKWHDPSGPFQNLPDINRLYLSLRTPDSAPAEFTLEYED